MTEAIQIKREEVAFTMEYCTHTMQSVFIELEVVGSDLLALLSERLPFHAIFD